MQSPGLGSPEVGRVCGKSKQGSLNAGRFYVCFCYVRANVMRYYL